MRPIVALLALALLPLAPSAASTVGPDPDEFTFCVTTTFGWEICASRDHTWYCYSVWTGMPPGVSDCFQFVGP